MITIQNAIIAIIIIAAIVGISVGFIMAEIAERRLNKQEDRYTVEIQNLQNQLDDHVTIKVTLFNSLDDNYVEHRDFTYAWDAFAFIAKQHSVYDIQVMVTNDEHEQIVTRIIHGDR